MRNEVQVRSRIWESVIRHGGPSAVVRAAKTADGGISESMLFKFRREGGPLLGKDSVNALAPVLDDIDLETWSAAMGVDVAAVQTGASA